MVSLWTQDHFAADGAASEWTDASGGMLKDGIQLSVRNDARRLCLLARFRQNDERWARAAARSGMGRGAGPGSGQAEAKPELSVTVRVATVP